MSYIIVDTKTGKEHKLAYWHTCGHLYDSERGAKIACSKLNKKTGGTWEVLEAREWVGYKAIHFPVKMVERTNMMSGKKYMEAEDTPCYMSPACETYWSM